MINGTAEYRLKILQVSWALKRTMSRQEVSSLLVGRANAVSADGKPD